MVLFLVGNNASLNERNNSGHTALDIAEKYDPEIAVILKEASETRHKLAIEKAKTEAAHTSSAKKHELLRQLAPKLKLKNTKP